ncbi:hypothetical protein [Aquibaculum sediminis]|uniref:hypothetical protein n=1 Tax=Aquibaculum sediminis TaxID=3231907 RepID=UPI003455C144
MNLDDDLAAVYRARVADLARQLRMPDAEAARQQLRDLIERVVISHDAAQGHRVTLEGAIVQLLALASAFGTTQKPAQADAGAGGLLCCSVKLVAGAYLHLWRTSALLAFFRKVSDGLAQPEAA